MKMKDMKVSAVPPEMEDDAADIGSMVIACPGCGQKIKVEISSDEKPSAFKEYDDAQNEGPGGKEEK